MAKKQGASGDHPRKQTEQSLIRMEPLERQFLDDAVARQLSDIRLTAPGAKIGITQFIKSGAIKLAEKVLGTTFEAYAKKAAGKGNGK